VIATSGETGETGEIICTSSSGAKDIVALESFFDGASTFPGRKLLRRRFGREVLDDTEESDVTPEVFVRAGRLHFGPFLILRVKSAITEFLSSDPDKIRVIKQLTTT